MKHWLSEVQWEKVYKAETANDKANVFQNFLEAKFNECFPKKTIEVANNDQPWFTSKLKELDRKKRIYDKKQTFTNGIWQNQ